MDLNNTHKRMNAKTTYYPEENKNISTVVDEKFATEGLVDGTPLTEPIMNGNGKVVWDMPSYKFIDQQVQHPDTVHPTLWAHERLNNKSGLFQVLPRVTKGSNKGDIYQIRTYDLATMTFIRRKTSNNWIVIDPLGGAETVIAAWKCFKATVDDPNVNPKANLYAILITHSHVDHYRLIILPPLHGN